MQVLTWSQTISSPMLRGLSLHMWRNICLRWSRFFIPKSSMGTWKSMWFCFYPVVMLRDRYINISVFICTNCNDPVWWCPIDWKACMSICQGETSQLHLFSLLTLTAMFLHCWQTQAFKYNISWPTHLTDCTINTGMPSTLSGGTVKGAACIHNII